MPYLIKHIIVAQFLIAAQNLKKKRGGLYKLHRHFWGKYSFDNISNNYVTKYIVDMVCLYMYTQRLLESKFHIMFPGLENLI